MKHFFYLQIFAFVAALSVTAEEGSELLVRSNIGNACTSNVDVDEGYSCIQESKSQAHPFVGGYIVKFDCSQDNPCDPGTKCIEADSAVTLCLARCSSDTHCRNGYSCQNGGVCLPN